jgi:RNA polymerase sigma factor (sigma-70 family)
MPTRITASRHARAEALALQIFAEQRRHLLWVAQRNSFNRDDAEEALQESLIAFLRKFNPDGGAHPLAWLTLVLKRKCWELRRRHHLDRRAGQEAERADDELGSVLEQIADRGRGPEALAELGEEAAAIGAAMAELKPDERRALSFVAEGYSYKEITALTGWTHTKINRCVAEGRARLRSLVASQQGFDPGRSANGPPVSDR